MTRGGLRSLGGVEAGTGCWEGLSQARYCRPGIPVSVPPRGPYFLGILRVRGRKVTQISRQSPGVLSVSWPSSPPENLSFGHCRMIPLHPGATHLASMLSRYPAMPDVFWAVTHWLSQTASWGLFAGLTP